MAEKFKMAFEFLQHILIVNKNDVRMLTYYCSIPNFLPANLSESDCGGDLFYVGYSL